jgi:prepilin-type N-terminal cleavage/methylation domain-containing protein
MPPSIRRRGFTLIEWLFVAGVLGILAVLITSTILSGRWRGDVSRAQVQPPSFNASLESVLEDNRRYFSLGPDSEIVDMQGSEANIGDANEAIIPTGQKRIENSFVERSAVATIPPLDATLQFFDPSVELWGKESGD